MGLTNEHVGCKISAKIKSYTLTRAELLITLCNETPCTSNMDRQLLRQKSCQKFSVMKTKNWCFPEKLVCVFITEIF